jgi:regulator of replication initiation timing
MTPKQLYQLTDNLLTLNERVSVIVKENEMLKKENDFLKQVILKNKKH